jgi:hypothetical protein
VRKVHLIGALVGVLVLALAAAAVASDQFTQSAKVKFSGKKANRSTGVNVTLKATDAGEPGAKPKRASRIVIKLAPGTRINPKASAQCNLPDQAVIEGKCPANSLIGKGVARANVAPLIPSTTEDVRAYASRTGITLLLSDNGEDPSPGQTFVLKARTSKLGVITVNVPELQPLPGVFAVLTDFTLKTTAKSKGKGSKKINLITTPKKCTKKGWTHTVTFSYADGSAKDVRKTKQACRK